LRKSVAALGWHYRIGVEDILDNLWDNIDHSLQSVRDEVAKTLAALYISSYHESVESVPKFLQINSEEGSLGLLPYQFSPALLKRVEAAFEKLEYWRQKRDLFSSTSQYILAAKTLSLFLSKLLQRSCAVGLIPILSKVIIPALLHFLNVRDDQEIMQTGVTLFKHLGNIPYPIQQVQPINDMIRDIGINATSWHQRMSILSYIQAFFFRQLFKMNHSQRAYLYDSVTLMLEDPQLEVRELAAETLAGMIRCSPVDEQMELTTYLHTKFVNVLEETRAWRSLRKSPANSGRATPTLSQPGTPSLKVPGMLSVRSSTPTSEYQQVLIRRHSAVLGLGSLVKAFPYQSPPPRWVPKVLATLAVKAASDSGMVGKSVKATLSDFKKTRQDTWHIDSKVFSVDQLEDLEGVLWKNYFV
jgi:proteasome activator subunit 4